MKNLIVITGPTAVGKTELSVRLAKKIGGEIISADSMQVYKGMDIGTAKITEAEKEDVPHFLIDEYEPDFDFNVTVFKERVMSCIEDIRSRGHIPIIAGGTGFYIQAVLYDIDFKENDGEDLIRKKYEYLLEVEGKHFLHKRLSDVDPEYAASVSENNVKKVIRALSFFDVTGEKLSKHNLTEREKASPFDFAYFVLTMDRERLYKRIDERVDKMFDVGLVDEVKALKDMGLTKNMTSMQGIGYKEVLAYLDGKMSLEEAKEKVKLNTRHFAKRQMTWFKREKNVIYVDREDDECFERILKEIE